MKALGGGVCWDESCDKEVVVEGAGEGVDQCTNTDTQTHRRTDTQIHRNTQTHRHTDTDTDTQTHTQTHTHTNTHTHETLVLLDHGCRQSHDIGL